MRTQRRRIPPRPRLTGVRPSRRAVRGSSLKTTIQFSKSILYLLVSEGVPRVASTKGASPGASREAYERALPDAPTKETGWGRKGFGKKQQPPARLCSRSDGGGGWLLRALPVELGVHLLYQDILGSLPHLLCPGHMDRQVGFRRGNPCWAVDEAAPLIVFHTVLFREAERKLSDFISCGSAQVRAFLRIHKHEDSGVHARGNRVFSFFLPQTA